MSASSALSWRSAWEPKLANTFFLDLILVLDVYACVGWTWPAMDNSRTEHDAYTKDIDLVPG